MMLPWTVWEDKSVVHIPGLTIILISYHRRNYKCFRALLHNNLRVYLNNTHQDRQLAGSEGLLADSGELLEGSD